MRVSVREFAVVPPEDGSLLRLGEDGTCDVDVRVVCSAGTYVRTLGESFGANLSAGAHLSALRRTRAGKFTLNHAVGLEKLQELAEAEALGEVLILMKAALPQFPAVHLTAEESRRARHGSAVGVARSSRLLEDGAHVRVLDEAGELLAVGVYDAGSEKVRPRVMLAAAEK